MPFSSSQPGTAGEACTRIVSVADPGLSIEDAARVMREADVGSLVVVEEIAAEERRVVGLLTDRDVALGIVAAQRAPQGLRIADLMSRPVFTVREDDGLLDALEVMRHHGVRRLPVVGAGDRLVGMLTADDVLAVLAEQLRVLAQALRAGGPAAEAARARGRSPLGE